MNYNSPAENFFLEHGISWILFRQKIIDERGRHIEGDFRLADGTLIEVKTDCRCYSSDRPTGRIPIEIEHPAHRGWLYHCIENKVEYVFFTLCSDAAGTKAVIHLLFPFSSLLQVVENHLADDAYRRRYIFSTQNGTKNLCIPFAEATKIPGTRQLIPLNDEEKHNVLRAIAATISPRKEPAGIMTTDTEQLL